MRGYAAALKMRREHAKLTVRELSGLIGRSTTFVTDFELRKKSNPPEPDMMRRLAQVLNWSEDEQLRAWGYQLGGDEQRGNPFPLDDPRWPLVEKVKLLSVGDPGADFTIKALGQLLDLYLNETELFTAPRESVSNVDVNIAHNIFNE